MKILTMYSLAVFSYFLSGLSFVFAIIEFILYLFKDREFNWWSFWMIPIFFILGIVFSVLSAFIRIRNHKSVKSRPVKKSKWMQRMEEIKEQRNKNR